MVWNNIRKSLFYFQYQRWLYPVDKTRVDDGTGEFTETDLKSENIKEIDSKKNK